MWSSWSTRSATTAPELDLARPGGSRRDEDEGVGDELTRVAVVLADPDLIVAKRIQVLDELHIALERQGWVFANAVERRHENPELHPVRLIHLPLHAG
jgi:hypothetical protein